MEIGREEYPMRVVRYAGLRRRAAAAAIDSTLLIATSWLIVLASAPAWAGRLTEMAADALEIHPGVFGQLFPIQMGILFAMTCAAALALSWVYGPAMESSARQATLGKAAVGIAVTDLEGHRISFRRGMARNMVKLASAFPVFAGLVVVGTTARAQGLHDILTGCLVVMKPKP
ncbi:MAG: RDD family protein [Dehalococcoidia bacterium]|nr:RDD family protein [Dehalococcoidia bacterium]